MKMITMDTFAHGEYHHEMSNHRFCFYAAGDTAYWCSTAQTFVVELAYYCRCFRYVMDKLVSWMWQYQSKPLNVISCEKLGVDETGVAAAAAAADAAEARHHNVAIVEYNLDNDNFLQVHE